MDKFSHQTKLNKKLNILYIITKLELGGAQKVCLELCKNLQATGHTALLISGAEGQLVAQLPNYIKDSSQIILLASLKRELSFKNLWLELKNFYYLVQQIKQLKQQYPDLIVHAHSTKAGLLGRWAAWLAGVKKRVYTIHGYSFNQYQPKLVAVTIYLLELVTSFITTDYVCVSELDLKTGTKLFPGFKRKATLIRAGVDDQLFTNVKNNIRPSIRCLRQHSGGLDFVDIFRFCRFFSHTKSQRSHTKSQRSHTKSQGLQKNSVFSKSLGFIKRSVSTKRLLPRKYLTAAKHKHSAFIKDSLHLGILSAAAGSVSKDGIQFTFGTVACFKKQKNLLDLLRAFKQLKILDPLNNYKLEIVGDGELRPELEAWISAHNLQANIMLHGWQEPQQLAAIMRSWQVFTLSSLWEGLPCAIVEARCLKLPVLAYNTGGINEVIYSGKNGFLYPQGDWLNLAQGMYKLAHDRELYARLSNYPDELQSFSYAYMSQAHVQMYQQ